MNSLLLEIFPEAVATTVFKFWIHPVADAFILGARERLLRPFLEELKELKAHLHEWENNDDPFEVAFKYMGAHDIDELDGFGVRLKNEIKFIEPQCKKYVERINKKRLFYYNSDDEENDDGDANEDVWYTFLKTCPYTSRPTQ
jgi:hypothetical protein